MTTPPLVIVSEHLSAVPQAWLADRCRVQATAYDESGFLPALAEADALILRSYTIAHADLLSAAPRLRVIGRAGTGLDNIDIAACRGRNIEVVYTPQANTQAVVEYVLRLVTRALRPIATLDHGLESEPWRQLRQDVCGTREIASLAVGVLGLGRIGTRIARVFTALGCTVQFNDLLAIPPEQRQGAIPVALEELFERSDLLTIHVDGRASNHGFVERTLINRMKPDAILLNTSRGCVVDNQALATFLRANPDAQAHLDVHEPEPVGDDNPLLALPNAVLYPHLAARTTAAMENMSWVVKDVWAVLNGETPKYPAP